MHTYLTLLPYLTSPTPNPHNKHITTHISDWLLVLHKPDVLTSSELNKHGIHITAPQSAGAYRNVQKDTWSSILDTKNVIPTSSLDTQS